MNVNNSTQGNGTFIWINPFPLHTRITLLSILLVCSLLGNILVLAVVYYNQNLRTNMNYLIVNMAVSDLLVPLVAVPLQISGNVGDHEWLVDGPFGEALCKLVPFLSDISPLVSSISLVIIAFQRFMAVVYPTRGQVLSHKTRWIAISFPWIVAMALLSTYFYTHRLMNIRGYTRCDSSWSPAFDSWKAETIFWSILSVVGFFLPLILTIILYTIIVYKLRQSLNNVMDMMEKETIRSRQRRNKRIFSMLTTIVVMFTICWCPLFAIILLQLNIGFSVWSDFDTRYELNFAFKFMWFFLAAINPCIYFVFLGDFRQGLKSLCCGKTIQANEPIPRRPRPPGGDSNQDPTDVHHLTSIPLQSRMNINTRRPRTPGGDSNQDPTCTPPHINTTSV